jgi:hypothetical protein
MCVGTLSASSLRSLGLSRGGERRKNWSTEARPAVAPIATRNTLREDLLVWSRTSLELRSNSRGTPLAFPVASLVHRSAIHSLGARLVG